MIDQLVAPKPPPRVSLRSLVSGISRHREIALAVVTGSLGLLASIAYAVTRDANETYARRLGLTPEEIGATQGVLIAKAVVVSLLVAAFVIVLGAAHFWSVTLLKYVATASDPRVVRWLKYRSKSTGRSLTSRGAAVLVLCSPLLMATILVILLLVYRGRLDPAIVLAGTAGCLGFGLSAVSQFAPSSPTGTTKIADVSFSVVGLVSAVSMISGGAVWLGVSHLEAEATDRGARVLAYDFDGRPGVVDLLLVGQPKSARITLVQPPSDPFNVCDGHRVPIFLAQSGPDYIVAMYVDRRAKFEGVYRLPREHYSVVTAIGPSAPCER